MVTYKCPNCGQTSSKYIPYWEHTRTTRSSVGGFIWSCTRDHDIECVACGWSGCMEHESCDNYIPREEVVIHG